jgi:hypothetical protein
MPDTTIRSKPSCTAVLERYAEDLRDYYADADVLVKEDTPLIATTFAISALG